MVCWWCLVDCVLCWVVCVHVWVCMWMSVWVWLMVLRVLPVLDQLTVQSVLSVGVCGRRVAVQSAVWSHVLGSMRDTTTVLRVRVWV